MITFKVTHETTGKLMVDGAFPGSRPATEADLAAAGYVKASPGMTQEQHIENQANGLRIAYKELDDLKTRVSGLRRMNDELAEKNEELIGLKNELGAKCERLEAMNDDLRSKLKKEYLEEVKDTIQVQLGQMPTIESISHEVQSHMLAVMRRDNKELKDENARLKERYETLAKKSRVVLDRHKELAGLLLRLAQDHL